MLEANWPEGAETPLQIIGERDDNTLEIHDDVFQSPGRIILTGKGSKVVMEEGVRSEQLLFEMGSNCTLEIGRDTNIGRLLVHMVDGCHLKIGRGTGMGVHNRILMHEAASVFIGSGCLIASGLTMAVSDMHSIVDLKTGKRVNPAADIVVGDNVWLGAEVMLMKGCSVGSGSIVGARAIVVGDLPDNSLSIGSPARVVREGVAWDFQLLPK